MIHQYVILIGLLKSGLKLHSCLGYRERERARSGNFIQCLNILTIGRGHVNYMDTKKVVCQHTFTS